MHGLVRWWDEHRPPRSGHRRPTCSSSCSSTCGGWSSGACSGCCATAGRRSTSGPPWPPSGPGIEELAGGLRAVVGGAMGATLAEAAEDAPQRRRAVRPGRGRRGLADHAHRLRHRRGGAGPGAQPARRRGRLLGAVRRARRGLAVGAGRPAAPHRPLAEPRPGRAARRHAGDPARPGRRRAPQPATSSRRARTSWPRGWSPTSATVRRVLDVFLEIRTGNVFDLTTLSVALRQLRNVVLVARLRPLTG